MPRMKFVPTTRPPRSTTWSRASYATFKDCPRRKPNGKPAYYLRIFGSGKNVKFSLSTCLERKGKLSAATTKPEAKHVLMNSGRCLAISVLSGLPATEDMFDGVRCR